MERLLALDIETTTQVENLPEDRRPGLDPAISAVTDVSCVYTAADGSLGTLLLTVADDAVARWSATNRETYLTSEQETPHNTRITGHSQTTICADETQLLRTFTASLRQIIGTHGIDTVVTWNGGTFDLPFLAERGQRMFGDPTLARFLALELDLSVYVKYDPIPGHQGGYRAAFDGTVHHLDIQAPFLPFAIEHGVRHSLKPVGRAAGFDPIEVDASNMHLLSEKERWEYVVSDASLTHALAYKYRTQMDLKSQRDPIVPLAV